MEKRACCSRRAMPRHWPQYCNSWRAIPSGAAKWLPKQPGLSRSASPERRPPGEWARYTPRYWAETDTAGLPEPQRDLSGTVVEPERRPVLSMLEGRLAVDVVMARVYAQHGVQSLPQLSGGTGACAVGRVRTNSLQDGAQAAVGCVHAKVPVVQAGVAIRGSPGVVSRCEVNAVAWRNGVGIYQGELRTAEGIRQPRLHVGNVVQAIGGLNAL